MVHEKRGSLSDVKSHSRPTLQQMATIDLGDLELEIEAPLDLLRTLITYHCLSFQDQHILNRSKSHNEASDYPSIMLVQKKEYWYKVRK